MNLEKNKTISVFGLGYVGCVSVACLAKAGHNVIGVDVNTSKVELISKGVATIVEPGLDDLLKAGIHSGNIQSTVDAEAAIQESDVVLITVGTPSLPSGELDLTHIYAVAEATGKALKGMSRFLTIAIRSTVKPGTCDTVAGIIEKYSGKINGKDFSIVANPEFLREGTAIADYENPPYILIGAKDERGANEVAAIYTNIEAEKIKVELSSAEIIKYVNNSWHALKVAFANEVGSICKQLAIDSHEVMHLFIKDKLLNISPYYLRPGYAYGGACLPKDLSALVSLAVSKGVNIPLLESVHLSNEAHIERAISLLRKNPKSMRLGFFGLSFKAGTDDIRNSPTLTIIRTLLQDGYQVSVFDDYVHLAISSEKNIALTMSHLEDIEPIMFKTVDELLSQSDVVVFSKKDSAYNEIESKLENKKIIDLVHFKKFESNANNYEGLAW